MAAGDKYRATRNLEYRVGAEEKAAKQKKRAKRESAEVSFEEVIKDPREGFRA